jgi:probable rRNA maturation factor
MNWWLGSSPPTKARRKSLRPAGSDGRIAIGLTYFSAEETSALIMPQRAFPIIEVIIAADSWQGEPDAEAVVQRAIAAASAHANADAGNAEIAVMLTDDATIRSLNKDFRGIDKPTNVLSFPAPEIGGADDDAAPRALGDIAIAYQTMRREADEEGKPFSHHLSHLAVHGFLHLIGHDHETDDEAEAMEALEVEILARLGIPDPYAERERTD